MDAINAAFESTSKLLDWRERIYSPDNPILRLYDPKLEHVNWLVGWGLTRGRTPLNWAQRLVLLELALFIGLGDSGEHCIDIRKLAKLCGYKVARTIELVDAAPSYFFRRGRTVWLTHPRLTLQLHSIARSELCS